MTERVYSYALRIVHDPDEYPELKARHEEMLREMFRERWGFDSTVLFWRHEEAWNYTVPETDAVVTVPEQWVCVTEGRRDEPE